MSEKVRYTKKDYTIWFSGNQKPEREGVYKRKIYDENSEYSHWNHYSYWTGQYWGLGSLSVKRAAIYKHIRSSYQSVQWCGLNKEF